MVGPAGRARGLSRACIHRTRRFLDGAAGAFFTERHRGEAGDLVSELVNAPPVIDGAYTFLSSLLASLTLCDEFRALRSVQLAHSVSFARTLVAARGSTHADDGSRQRFEEY